MFSRAGEPKRMWVIEAANHRFSNNRVELCQRLLEALAWMNSPHAGIPIAREGYR